MGRHSTLRSLELLRELKQCLQVFNLLGGLCQQLLPTEFLLLLQLVALQQCCDQQLQAGGFWLLQ
jgi:hypothetical protein